MAARAASVDQKAAGRLPDAIMKIIKEKGYHCLNRFLMQMKLPYSGRAKMPTRTLISKE